MMQFINTFEGVKTRCVCKPDQTLLSTATKTEKNGLAMRDYTAACYKSNNCTIIAIASYTCMHSAS